MFKYELDQTVWYIKEDRVHSGPVLSRKYVDNKFPKDLRCTDEQEYSFGKFKMEGIWYATIHGIFTENQLASSKKELFEIS